MRIAGRSVLLIGLFAVAASLALDMSLAGPTTVGTGAIQDSKQTNTYTFVCLVTPVTNEGHACKLTVDFSQQGCHGHPRMLASVIARPDKGRVEAKQEMLINMGFLRLTIGLTLTETNKFVFGKYDAEFVTGFNETGEVKTRYTTTGDTEFPPSTWDVPQDDTMK